MRGKKHSPDISRRVNRIGNERGTRAQLTVHIVFRRGCLTNDSQSVYPGTNESSLSAGLRRSSLSIFPLEKAKKAAVGSPIYRYHFFAMVVD